MGILCWGRCLSHLVFGACTALAIKDVLPRILFLMPISGQKFSIFFDVASGTQNHHWCCVCSPLYALWLRLRDLRSSVYHSMCGWRLVPALPLYCVFLGSSAGSCRADPLRVRSPPGEELGRPLFHGFNLTLCIEHLLGKCWSSYLVVLCSVL